MFLTFFFFTLCGVYGSFVAATGEFPVADTGQLNFEERLELTPEEVGNFLFNMRENSAEHDARQRAAVIQQLLTAVESGLSVDDIESCKESLRNFCVYARGFKAQLCQKHEDFLDTELFNCRYSFKFFEDARPRFPRLFENVMTQNGDIRPKFFQLFENVMTQNGDIQLFLNYLLLKNYTIIQSEGLNTDTDFLAFSTTLFLYLLFEACNEAKAAPWTSQARVEALWRAIGVICDYDVSSGPQIVIGDTLVALAPHEFRGETILQKHLDKILADLKRVASWRDLSPVGQLQSSAAHPAVRQPRNNKLSTSFSIFAILLACGYAGWALGSKKNRILLRNKEQNKRVKKIALGASLGVAGLMALCGVYGLCSSLKSAPAA